ncbi:MAG: hypothetical protein ACK4HF_17635 [Paracoccaceae bacterium]
MNAVLAIIACVGLFVAWAVDGPAAAAGWLIVMVVVRLSLRLINTLFTAATGAPLFYDVKILDRDNDGK